MKLKDCRSVKEITEWMRSRGFTPGENAYVDRVDPVHGSTSLHYKTIVKGAVVFARDKQGNLAIDVNDNDVRDDKMPFDNEHEALLWLYNKMLTVFGPRGYDVLDEMFFNGLGFIHERPTNNHPITGHDGHLHAGFKKLSW
jgi:hypothetical protein